MPGLLDGRVVIITGAGRGIGRAHALAFAAEGARVVVNDIGVGLDGSAGTSPAQEVVEEITAAGGEAVTNGDDVADWSGAKNLIDTAVNSFGRLDVLVNNAGFLRDRMLANMSEEEWDAVIRVHLKGHFAPLRHAAAYWRDEFKAGNAVDARVINTSSAAGLQGSVGQGNYAAAKAGIATLTLQAAAEMGRYGITVNAIAPAARTRMTEAVFAETMAKPEDGAFDAMAPENVSPLVVWLGSPESREVTGKVFEVEAGIIRVAEGWAHGPQVDKEHAGTQANWAPWSPTCWTRPARRFRSTARKANPFRRHAVLRRISRVIRAKRGVSMGLGLQDDDRDLAGRVRLVFVEVRVQLDQLGPVVGTFCVGRGARRHGADITLDLNGDFRIRLQVEIPRRIGGASALRRDQNHLVAVG